MAIDLPETIPSIINSFKKSNSAKNLHKKLSKSSRFSFLWPKSRRSEQCRCSFPNCKDCQEKVTASSEGSENPCRPNSPFMGCQNFDNNNESETEGDCEQTLLTTSDAKSDLNFENVYDWNLRDNSDDAFPDKLWKGIKKDKYYRSQKKGEELLKPSDEIIRRRKRVFLLSSVGLALISLAIFIRLFDPLEKILNWKLNLAPGSFVLNLWLSPPVTVYVKVYIFNFTNPVEFLAGKEKLKVQEIGPYVYQEQLRNTNPIFHPNGTLSYIPRRTAKPLPELSVADPKLETILVPNIPLLGIASMISEASMFTNLAFITFTKYLNSQPFINLTVHDYLWGYDDPIVRTAHKVLPSWVSFSHFGLLDRMYDEGDNLITIRLSDNGLNVTDPGYMAQYSIDTWNGSPGLTAWGYKPGDVKMENGTFRPKRSERCKFIRGATDGVLFPRNISPLITPLLFRKNFCRIIPMEYEREGITKNGIPGYYYKLPENVFDSAEDSIDQACYCNPNKKKCLPKGLSDITPCYYNIPAAVSFPHFLGADPKLLQDIEGLSPDKHLHGTNIVLQPNLGMAMEFRTRIQTNIIMKKIRYNSRIAPFSDLALPIVWIELAMEGLPGYINVLLYLVVYIAPGFFTAVEVISAIAGIGLLMYTCLLFTKFSKARSRARCKFSPIISPIIRGNNLLNISKKNSLMSVLTKPRKSSSNI